MCLITGESEGGYLVSHHNRVDLLVGQPSLIETASLVGWQLQETGQNAAGLQLKAG